MLEVILLSVIFGIVITLVVQYIWLKRWFLTLPIIGPPFKPQHQQYCLPQELLEIINDPGILKKKETCISLNLIFQFLFNELKDTKRLRGWVMKRMNMEFAELLQTTTGKLLDTIVTRDFNLGNTFPIIKNTTVQSVDNKDNGLEEVTMLLDLTYNGGFQLAVDVDMVFGKSAFLSVTVTKLEGKAQLQFTRNPYTHWSFSFIEEPVVEFDVESQFEGRPVPQITSLIINQIRRSIKKKHTLPAYKIRYKPFFIKPEPLRPSTDIFYHGKKVSQGHMQITVVKCQRLVKPASEAYIYCTLAVDSLPWVELMSSRRKLWVTHDIEICKVPGQNVGLTFKENWKQQNLYLVETAQCEGMVEVEAARYEQTLPTPSPSIRPVKTAGTQRVKEFVVDRYEELVLVDGIAPNTPADRSDIKKNDVMVSVGGVKVTSSKQGVKLIKQSTSDRVLIRIERSSSLKGLSPISTGYKVEEEALLLKPENEQEVNKEPEEEYINITITQVDPSNASPSSKTSSSSSLSDPVGGGGGGGGNRKSSSFSILGSSSGLFHRKNRGKTDGGKSPSSSPETARKFPPKTDEQGQGEKVKVTLELTDTPIKEKKSDKPEIHNGNASSSSMEGGGSSREGSATGAPPQGTPPRVSTHIDASSSGAADEDDEEERFDLKKTQMVKASQDPEFNETFDFNIEGEQNYLNICVWSRTPEKTDKQNRIIKQEKDALLGHVSLSLMDIALDCLGTLQGDSRLTVHLTPAELKAGATRAKFAHLSSHPGFDERLCYGDITLYFLHSSQPLSKVERRHIQKIREENDAVAEKKKIQAQHMEQNRLRALEAGKHDFVNTHFQTATYCNFCHKKIWLKAAFQCSVCGLVCHKKCTEKCQANTICCKDGYKHKELPPEISRVSSNKPDSHLSNGSPETGKDQATKEKTSFLNRFRKELGKEKNTSPQNSPKNTRRGTSSGPLEIPTILNRRNSASSVEHTSDSDAAVTKAGGLLLLGVGGGSAGAGGQVPRTRSSTSLQDLIRQNATPSVDRLGMDIGEVKAMLTCSDTSDSEEEDEMNLLKFFEEQKHSHNADELVVTAAKEMGKELYANLNPAERKDKLDSTLFIMDPGSHGPIMKKISKMQQEIDKESENRAELGRIEQEVTDTKQKTIIRTKIDKSDEKIQSLALLMLHYCSGLQHCMDQQEMEKQQDGEPPSQSASRIQITHDSSADDILHQPGSANAPSNWQPDKASEINNIVESMVESGKGDMLSSGSFEASLNSTESHSSTPKINTSDTSNGDHFKDISRQESSDSEMFNDCIEKGAESEAVDDKESSGSENDGSRRLSDVRSRDNNTHVLQY